MAHKRKSALSMQMRNSQKQFEHSLFFKTDQKKSARTKMLSLPTKVHINMELQQFVL